MTVDMALTLCGLLLETVFLAVMIARQIHRTLPSFVAFIGVALATDLSASLVPHFISPQYFLYIWIASLFLEFVSFLLLTAELGRNVLRQNRSSSPNWLLILMLFGPIVLALSLLSHWSIPEHLAFVWWLDLRLSQLTAVLDLGAFLTLIWWSAFCKFHWPTREFRIAIGIGLEALVGLATVIVHSHQEVGPSYHWVDVSASFAYIGVLVYWVQYFVFEDTVAADSRDLRPEFAAMRRARGDFGTRETMVNSSPGFESESH